MKLQYLTHYVLVIGFGVMGGWALIDPLTVGMGGIAVGGLFGAVKYLTSYFTETCNDQWIKPNMSGLANDLENNLHGQHLVKKAVLHNIRNHINNDEPSKALVLSFHGWTGGGKNFVSNMIVQNMYAMKEHSDFVHWFIGNIHFPHGNKIEEYKDQLSKWIAGNVSICEHSMFIFDEVDKMPIGLLDSVKPYMDYYHNIHRIDFRKSIFILLSNTGGSAITKKMLDHWEQGKNRDEITIRDFEELIEKGAFNEKIEGQGGWLSTVTGDVLSAFTGGLFRSSLIEKNLVDYYVPFLPLERQHVKLCVRDELRRRGVRPTNEMLDEIADKMPYFPEDKKIFSRVGCKRIQSKVFEYITGNEF